jgi:hypothetical protein
MPVAERRDDFLDAEMRADVRQLLLDVTPRQGAVLLLVDLPQAGRFQPGEPVDAAATPPYAVPARKGDGDRDTRTLATRVVGPQRRQVPL